MGRYGRCCAFRPGAMHRIERRDLSLSARHARIPRESTVLQRATWRPTPPHRLPVGFCTSTLFRNSGNMLVGALLDLGLDLKRLRRVRPQSGRSTTTNCQLRRSCAAASTGRTLKSFLPGHGDRGEGRGKERTATQRPRTPPWPHAHEQHDQSPARCAHHRASARTQAEFTAYSAPKAGRAESEGVAGDRSRGGRE